MYCSIQKGMVYYISKVNQLGGMEMYKNADTKLSELEKGKWCLLRSNYEISPNSEDVVNPSHFMVKREDDKVTIMTVFATAESKLETVKDWHEMSYPEVLVIHDDIFAFDEKLAKYSLDTLSVKELDEEVLHKKGTLVNSLIFRQKIAKVLYPFYERVAKLAYEIDLPSDKIIEAFEDALPETV